MDFFMKYDYRLSGQQSATIGELPTINDTTKARLVTRGVK